MYLFYDLKRLYLLFTQVTGIAMPLSILGISWSFISFIYSMCVCMYIYVYVYVYCMYMYMYIYIYIYIYIYNKYRFRHRLGTGTVLKVSIWHRYRKNPKRYPTLVSAHSTRGMASSWAWSSGIAIGETCVAAGWSSLSTFSQFYNLDVPAFASRLYSASAYSMVLLDGFPLSIRF